ncbi:TetR/AcrR family transcriptional regulator [Mycolicibacterium brumae]|uniref:TetR/AcrR family transcriptional regulator n=1 Tax=Mycolicibacterium brumae TaxID=85968 RepID=UPI000ACB64B4|nr:TetR/AcrR family transcriptional regulator [Mycolicibacterium brumae]MCV7191391.1 TetR/AcrR family transcriptional regulator [Mycolicibacterium brumae]RWA16103.1 hypothetical protein MBRU_08315 [Mycolicibacterium brumae DSM 44177]UWW09501.1 TetR/AcrR family transcriptional regulator [Mycolicibacterium brumae]
MTRAPASESDRRTQLTRAAFEVFTDRGYRNCSVADIVSAAGLSHGSFYNYFSNRREILDATIDLGLAERGPELAVPDDPAATLEEFLDAVTAPLRSLHSLSETDNKLVSLIVFDAGAIDDELTRRAVEIFGSFAEAIGRQIEHGVRAGYLRPELDAEILGEMVLCMSLTALLPAHGGADLPDGIDHLVTQMRELLRAALAA